MQRLYSEAKAAEASGDLATAEAKYESILRIAPRLGPAYNNLGLLYFKQREFAKAASVLEKGLKVNPTMPSASALLGMSMYEMGKYAEARPWLESALRSNPNDQDARLILANDLLKLGEPEVAATHLQQLVHRQPENQEAWYLLGEIYMKLSEQALTKMNAIDPNSVLVHEMSGEIMESMKNYDGALLEYKKAVEMAPQRPGTHYKLGNAYWALSEWDAALREFQAELGNDPGNCMANAKIGDIMVEQRMNAEEALAQIDKALAMCPKLTDARVDRGRALLRLNRNEEAIADLEAAEKGSPDEPSAHFFLSQAYRAVGRTQEAQAEMKIFSKLEESARTNAAQRAEELLKNREQIHNDSPPK